MRLWAHLVTAVVGLSSTACAHLHTVEFGDIDNTLPASHPVEVKHSETGLDVAEAARLGNAVTGGQFSSTAKGIENIWKLITYGPKTGNVVFSDTYADYILAGVQKSCDGGRLTGFMTIREGNKYPVVSGEIVRVRAFCSPLAAPAPPSPAPAPAPVAPR